MGNEQGQDFDAFSPDGNKRKRDKFRDHLNKIENKLTTQKEIDFSAIEPNPAYKDLQAGQLTLRFGVKTYAEDDEKNAFKQLFEGIHWIALVYKTGDWEDENLILIDKFHLDIGENDKIRIRVEQGDKCWIKSGYNIGEKDYPIKNKSYHQLIEFVKGYTAKNVTYKKLAENCRKFAIDFATYCQVPVNEIDYIKLGKAYYASVDVVKDAYKGTKTAMKGTALTAVQITKESMDVAEKMFD
eukprot:119683_1